MKWNNLILIILTASLFGFFTGCGYTIVKRSSKTSEYKNTQQNYSYALSGYWTKREGGTPNHNGHVNAWIQDYYLVFSNGRYGFSFRERFPDLSGNYYTESDTLILIAGNTISKYLFSRDGSSLILNFISFERQNETRSFPIKLEGVWRPSY